VVDDPAKEGDVGAGPDTHVVGCGGARPSEAGVDVNYAGAALTRLHHPLVADRMALGHVRAHDHDAVRVLHVLLEGRCAAPAERGAQTGHRGRVSYARLVLDLDEAERRHQLLDRVVLLIVEGRPAQVGDAHRPAQRAPLLVLVLPGVPAGRDDPVGDHVHRLVERERLPLGPVRPPVLHLVLAQRARHVATAGGSLRAQPAAGDGAVGVALDLGDLPLLHVYALAAPYGAVRADRADDPVSVG